jgi:hypothetical protein
MSAADKWLNATWELVIDDEATIYVIETQEAAEAFSLILRSAIHQSLEGEISLLSVRRL